MMMPKYQNSLFGFKSKIEEIVDFDKISEKISEPRLPIEIYIIYQNLSPDDFRKESGLASTHPSLDGKRHPRQPNLPLPILYLKKA
jgi:hypothetical protein